jgi:DNA-binding MarR family transcriptional regulator
MPMPGEAKRLTQSICNCATIRQVSRHMTQFYDSCLAPYGLTVSQFSILWRLNRSGPRSINTLAREMLVDRTTLGRNLRPLEREGLLELAPDATDKRTRSLTLTPAGIKRATNAREGWKKAQQRFEHAYGAERTAQLRNLLHAVVETELDADQVQPARRPKRARSKSR